MKRIGMYVWNNFLNDDRVRKKAESLAKEHYIVVHSVCKKPQARPVIQYSENIEVHFYWFNNFAEWLLNRSIGNGWFWKDKAYNYDIVDCNDPDTLWAGMHCKKFNKDVKIVYDSHEYWKGVMRKEYNFLYTAYSYIVNTWHYLTELRLAKFADRIICVSGKIKERLVKAYNKPTSVIMNVSSHNPKSCDNKINRVCFFGSKPRLGIIQIGSYFKKYGIEPVMIGNPVDHKDWTDLGYLDKIGFQNEMAKSKYGLCIYDVTCDSLRFSLPNKLFEYIQAEIPIIYNEGMESVEEFITKFDIGVKIDKSEESIRSAIIDLQVKYDQYVANIKKIKPLINWENQEERLLEIYRFGDQE